MKSKNIYRKISLLAFMVTFLLISTTQTEIISGGLQRTSGLNAVDIAEASSPTKVYVDPPSLVDTSLIPGSTFTVDVNIADVSDLYSWQFYMNWSGPLLNVTKVTEGPFLKSGGSTFFTKKIYNGPDPKGVRDYILVACTLTGIGPGVTGSGILATVTFLVEGTGGSVLHLYNTELTDSLFPDTPPIEHTAEDGYFTNFPCDLAVTDVELPYQHPKLYANITYDVGINVTNLGSSSAATFNVSLEIFWVKGGIMEYYAEKTVAGLDPGASTREYFGVTITHAGDYKLNATADCRNAIAESNETNNSMIINVDGRLPGDVDGDSDVDFDDIVAIAMAYGSKIGSLNWDEQADLDADGDVDFDDVVTAAMNYGRKAHP